MQSGAMNPMQLIINGPTMISRSMTLTRNIITTISTSAKTINNKYICGVICRQCRFPAGFIANRKPEIVMIDRNASVERPNKMTANSVRGTEGQRLWCAYHRTDSVN